MNVYVLFLNDMRSSNVERVGPVFKASSPEALERLLVRERVPDYTDARWPDARWLKSFREGGPLEWFNPPSLSGGIEKLLTPDEAAERARERQARLLEQVPEIPS